MKYLALVLLMLTGCDSGKCYKNYYMNITDFEVNLNAETKNGIKVDTGGYYVNLQSLDKRILKIETCLLEVMKDLKEISAQNQQKWQCLKNKFNPDERLKKECLTIKIVPPINSKCSAWQTIGVIAPNEHCIAKGLMPTDECPCMWRTAIQDENVIISPPEETRDVPKTSVVAPYLWELGRIMTSCNLTWYSPFAKCLSF